MKSETIGKLAEALAKAQGMMEFAKKDSTNPHFKSKYADIASVIDAVRECLSKNNLSYVQYEEDDHLVTLLMHSSGEWISGKMKLLMGKQDMQGKGSALTYARRYGLASMVGIAQDDDDGNQAAEKPGSKDKAGSAPKVITPKPVESEDPAWRPTEENKQSIRSQITLARWQPAHVTKFITENFKPKTKLSELTLSEFTAFQGALDNAIRSNVAEVGQANEGDFQ